MTAATLTRQVIHAVPIPAPPFLDEEPSHLFVYGTLMRGLVNHTQWGMDTIPFVGFGTIPGVMYRIGSFPGVVPGLGVIKGEVYRLTNETLVRRLDQLEGYVPGRRRDLNLFHRDRVEVTLKGGETLTAWVYYLGMTPQRKEYPRIHSGNFRLVADVGERTGVYEHGHD